MAIDFTEMASRYLGNRMDQAMQPFTDPEAYMSNRMGIDENGNVKPKSTTINYNDDGTQTVTTKHEVTPQEQPVQQVSPEVYQAPAAPMQQAAPAITSIPQQQMPQMGAPQGAVNPAALAEEERRKQMVAQQAAMQARAQQAAPQPAPQVAPQAQPQVAQPTMGAGPINPQQAAQPVNIPQLPQAGPPVQVAGPAQMPPQAAPTAIQTAPAGAPPAAPTTMPMATPEGLLRSWTDDIASIQNNVTALGKYISNEANPEEGRAFAGRVIAKMYKEKDLEDKAKQKVMESVQTGDLLPIVKESKKNTEEASYIKAYMFARLGLTDLAKEEQKKLGAGSTWKSVTGPNGERALIKFNADGLPLEGLDDAGKDLKMSEVARLATNAMPTSAHQMPSVHGSPVINAQGEVGTLMMDPQTRSTYVLVGNQKRPTTGWTTMAQNVQNVYGAAGAQQMGKQAAQGFQNQPLPAMPGPIPAPAGAQPMAQPQVGAPAAAPAPQAQPAPVARPQVGGAPIAQPAPITPAQVAAQAAPQPAPQAAPITTPGVGAPAAGLPVYKQQQAAELGTEAGKAAIQQQKELNVAEQKPPAEAKGKNVAKDINNQRFANETHGLIKPIADLIKQSTGSGIGTKVDELTALFGHGTEGAAKIAQLEPMIYPILMNIPRFEGAQSDADVKNYQRAAGDFANSEKPVATRLAALQGMITLLKKYDKKGENDWTFGETKPTTAQPYKDADKEQRYQEWKRKNGYGG